MGATRKIESIQIMLNINVLQELKLGVEEVSGALLQLLFLF